QLCHRSEEKSARTATLNTWVLNAAIGLQVLLGSLTTGLSAVAATGGKSVCGLSTIVASYLAKARGSNEPDFSNTRVKNLEQFLRDCDAFVRDYGHVVTEKDDDDFKGVPGRKSRNVPRAVGSKLVRPSGC
ncbi:hypothetical protein CPB84DRAFT_1678062, partial [Gymnopilus junonius]